MTEFSTIYFPIQKNTLFTTTFFWFFVSKSAVNHLSTQLQAQVKMKIGLLAVDLKNCRLSQTADSVGGWLYFSYPFARVVCKIFAKVTS